VSEYAGLLLNSNEARLLPEEEQTWFRTLVSSFWEIDGNPSRFTNGHIEMARRHVLGSLVNHSVQRRNCSFETEDWESKDLQSTNGLTYSKCIFIRATRDIYPHEQLLISYGATANRFYRIPF
jgi:hypothetical protein